MSSDAPHDAPRPFATPIIEDGVVGPRGEQGFLLRAPFSEALAWDVENEVASPRRVWLEDRAAWWIAAGYRDAVLDAVLRSFPSVLVLGRDEDRLISRDGVVERQERML